MASWMMDGVVLTQLDPRMSCFGNLNELIDVSFMSCL